MARFRLSEDELSSSFNGIAHQDPQRAGSRRHDTPARATHRIPRSLLGRPARTCWLGQYQRAHLLPGCIGEIRQAGQADWSQRWEGNWRRLSRTALHMAGLRRRLMLAPDVRSPPPPLHRLRLARRMDQPSHFRRAYPHPDARTGVCFSSASNWLRTTTRIA